MFKKSLLCAMLAAASLTMTAAPSFAADKEVEEVMAEATKGNPNAQKLLARYYAENKETDKAIHWWKLAAKQGSQESVYNLGRAYLTGDGVGQDIVKAYVLWNSLKDKDDTMAGNLKKIEAAMNDDQKKKAKETKLEDVLKD